MSERSLLFLGVLALFLIAIVLASRPTPQPYTSPAVEIRVPDVVITPLGDKRFMVTDVSRGSGYYGHYVVIDLASGKPEVVAEGNWKPFLFSEPWGAEK